MKRVVAMACCIMLAGLGAAGCGKKAEEKTAEKFAENLLEKAMGGNADVDINGEDVKITTDQGTINVSEGNVSLESEAGSVKIVSGDEAKAMPFPADLYRYPNAEVIRVSVTPAGTHYELESRDSAAEVFQAVKTEMEKLGWKATMAHQAEGDGVLIMDKAEKSARVVIGEDEGKTTVAMMLSGQ